MITISVNPSCVSVGRVSHVLQKFQGCASHSPSRSFGAASSEAATEAYLKKERRR